MIKPQHFRQRTGAGRRLLFGLAVLAMLWTTVAPAAAGAAGLGRPNVLFLCVDDMRDWVNCLHGYPGHVETPHIDQLASRGVLFTNAHCPSPLCAPSRAAVMTGLRPSTTGLYNNSHWWYPNRPETVSLPALFRDNGYSTAGAGKIFHHTAGNNPPGQWDSFHRLTFRNDPWFRGAALNYPWSTPTAFPPDFPLSGIPGLGHENDWGVLSIEEADYDDALSVRHATEFLNRKHDKPFFLACGIFRPHLPWYVPQQYFDLYDVDKVVVPTVPEDDLDDVPAAGRELAQSRRSDLKKIRGADRMRHAVRAYLASISFADSQIGTVIAALDSSDYADNTVIVFWSDHGWHLGEKDHWHKSTLWEVATRVPLVIASPQISSGECNRPVNLIDVFPTLTDLCELSTRIDTDGQSLVPLLNDPNREWDRPAVTEYQQGNASVRSQRYRYIQYRDGSEELYDHEQDPHEWHNLAGDRAYREVLKSHARWIPADWAAPALPKKAFRFQPETYTWIRNDDGSIIDGSAR